MTQATMSRKGAFIRVTLAYGVATLAGIAVAVASGVAHPIAGALVADVAATLVIFCFSVGWNNSSLYDPYWSVAPLPIALYWALFAASPDADTGRTLLVLAVIGVWGWRLTFNWGRGWRGIGHEDWRYARFRQQLPRAYWLVSFAGIHMFPTLIVFLSLLPIWPALTLGGRPLGPLDALGLGVAGIGIAFEWIADRQLHAFVSRKPAPGETLRSGLWRFSRHPNYFGEISLWWGLWLFGVAAAPGWAWTLIGPLAMTAMFLVISIPLIETRALERRAGYAQVIAETPRLVPWPSRRGG